MASCLDNRKVIAAGGNRNGAAPCNPMRHKGMQIGLEAGVIPLDYGSALMYDFNRETEILLPKKCKDCNRCAIIATLHTPDNEE